MKPRPDSAHMMKCRTCGLPFDMRDLDQVIAHEHEGPHEVTGIRGSAVAPVPFTPHPFVCADCGGRLISPPGPTFTSICVECGGRRIR